MTTLYVTLGILVVLLGYGLYNFFYQRKVLTALTQEEFIEGYRKAQLIDVREPNEFESGHILGARNIPLSQLKMRLKEIRPDKPVYLYDHTGARSGRAAIILHKKGYKHLFYLKGGFKKWTGKIKVGK
ncbi:rhodanese-like domain-containing protein [Fervidibacillus albus]|uniref:Rhodanese-like domain-containing protein n=1 Tax=Fervidibacillus albus TaxID=2980026 RepID=A0A9E8RWU3_9BACI|nr:rhodanese-like domain-containing protein [Fervidibacillus albus]WAA10443.1 rhodanese-like domain-containing protein [Fervidibacillus albus]